MRTRNSKRTPRLIGRRAHVVAGHDLHDLPVLAQLPPRLLARVETLSTPATFRAGTALCRQGELGREAFVLLAGTADVMRDGVRLATLGAGDVVGELALLGDGRRNATVVATADVDALVMSPREFAGVMALPGVGDSVRRLAGERAPSPAA